MSPPIVVIGAGIGGLSAAIRLAHTGREVLVVEQNPAVGGKMSQVTAQGFRFDTGPSVITMRHVFEALWRTTGRDLANYLTFLPVDPLTRYFYRDGTVLNLSRNLSETLPQLEQLDPRDVEGYLAYLAYAAAIHRITGPVFIYDEPPHLKSFWRVPVRDMFKVDPLRTMHQAIKGFAHSPHLRQLLGRFATYVGASPYLAPATLNVIAHVELSGGVWYPQGGVYAIAQAMQKLAEEVGVTIHTSAAVQKIEVQNGRAAGVWVADEFIPASTVIANVDVTTVHEKLLPPLPAVTRQLAQLQKLERSCSGFILLLGVEGASPDLAHHNILFTPDYPAEFEAIFQQKIMPTDPTLYVAITSKSDPSHAPAGCENWFVLVNAPAGGQNWDWHTQTEPYTAHILQKLASWGHDLTGRVLYQQVLTPLNLQKQSGAYLGALYGSSSNDRWAAFRRPHNRSPHVAGLYFVGGTTHPGGGVPMVTLSGQVTAGMVLNDLEKNG